MSSPSGQSNILADTLSSPTGRAVLALLTVGAALVRYVKGVNGRLGRSREISENYALTSWRYKAVAIWPYYLHWIVAYGIFVVATAQFAILSDTFLFASRYQNGMPLWAQDWVAWLNGVTVLAFLVAIAMWILFELRAIEYGAAKVTGLFDGVRSSFDWTVASWQLRREEARRVLAPSSANVTRFADIVINGIVTAPPNRRLALRPNNLSDCDAANILFFGHVIEHNLSHILKTALDWTDIFQALAKVNEDEGAPFSPQALAQIGSDQDFKSIVLKLNDHLASGVEGVPDNASLEAFLSSALDALKSEYDCDARNMATKGNQSTSYDNVLLQYRGLFEEHELGMARQFAKLFILWNVLPNATRPKVFHSAFNSNMFVQYLDEEVLRHEGDSFRLKDDLVLTCFYEANRLVLLETKRLLEASNDSVRKKWRQEQEAEISKRGVDWDWWIYYRTDQHIYSLGRTHDSPVWESVAGEEIRKK